jgi:hypothetical protein
MLATRRHKPTTPPALDGAIVTMTGVPGFITSSERCRLQPLLINCAGFGSSSSAQLSVAP